MSESKEQAIGIDLGTTQSVVSYVQNGKPETIRSAEGDLATPSLVAFHPSGIVVGEEAVKCAEFEPEVVASYVKRDMGRSEYQKKIRGRRFPPEVIQSFLLKRLVEDAQTKLGDVNKAVVTVPAYFNEPRRKATQDVGRLADLEVLDIINEPSAAAIAYGVQEGFLSPSGETDKPEIIVVYDLGGGTFDVTVMEIDGHRYKALGTAGDVYLGGLDWDNAIVDHVAEIFVREHGVDPRDDLIALSALARHAQSAKRTLTARTEATIPCAYQGHILRINFSRDEFAALTEHLLQRTLFTVQRVLTTAGRKWSDVTRLLLVGGSTRMPMVQEMLESESGLAVDRSLAPDEAVSHGAAIYANLLVTEQNSDRPEILVTNVNSHDLGVLGFDPATSRPRRQVLIPRNTALPVTRKGQFVTRHDNQSKVDVNVIEGGNDSGDGAAQIGKCSITDLPAGLPAKTPVTVSFTYADDGRLSVTARLPAARREIAMTIQRASGLSDENIATWKQRIQDGLFLEGDDEYIDEDDDEELLDVLDADDDSFIGDDDVLAAEDASSVIGEDVVDFEED